MSATKNHSHPFHTSDFGMFLYVFKGVIWCDFKFSFLFGVLQAVCVWDILTLLWQAGASESATVSVFCY